MTASKDDLIAAPKRGEGGANAAFKAGDEKERSLWLNMPLETRAASITSWLLMNESLLTQVAIGDDLHWAEAIERLVEKLVEGMRLGPPIGVDLPLVQRLHQVQGYVAWGLRSRWIAMAPEGRRARYEFASKTLARLVSNEEWLALAALTKEARP